MWKYTNKTMYFLSGQFISAVGDWLNDIAIITILYKLTGSKLSIALSLIVKFFPKIISPLFFFNNADNFDSKKLLIILDIFRALLMFVLYYISKNSMISLIFVMIAFQHFVNPIYFSYRFKFLTMLG